MKSFTNAVLILSVSLFLTACGIGDTSSETTSNLVSDQPAVNNAPSISGTPSSSVNEGSRYQFTPVAFDEDGDGLNFSVENLPAWAQFDPTTGALIGTPDFDAAGDYTNITISVTDGELSSTLPAFTITVVDVVDQTPPPATDPAVGAPTLTSVAVNGAGIVLSWNIGTYAVPEGGYDIFVDGVDTGSQYRTTSTTATIPGLDLTLSHCFNVESRYTDSSQYFASDQRCSAAQDQPNQSPEISGTPAASVIAGDAYDFTPSATDPDGDDLTFSIQNLPDWASFDTATGNLTGVPEEADVGTFDNILISVSDGAEVVALARFSIDVTSPSAETGSISLNWTAPSTRSDGSPLDVSEIGGYQVYVGDTSDSLQMEVDLNDGSAVSTTISGKPLGSYFVAITVYDTDGKTSSYSNVIQVTVTN